MATREMTTLLKDVEKALSSHGHSWDDVLWVSRTVWSDRLHRKVADEYEVPVEDFMRLAAKTEYEIGQAFVWGVEGWTVAGDGWWWDPFTRYRESPRRPSRVHVPDSACDEAVNAEHMKWHEMSVRSDEEREARMEERRAEIGDGHDEDGHTWDMRRLNLLIETENCLRENGKSWDDVRWVSVERDGGRLRVPVDEFRRLAASFDYDEGYGSVEVDGSLVVAGDGWWLERAEYDGSEWWEFRRPPEEPEATAEGVSLKNDHRWHRGKGRDARITTRRSSAQARPRPPTSAP